MWALAHIAALPCTHYVLILNSLLISLLVLNVHTINKAVSGCTLSIPYQQQLHTYTLTADMACQ